MNFRRASWIPLTLTLAACGDGPSLCQPAPLLFGHRGSPALAPENTIPSYQLAISEGGQGAEIDVQLTADQQIVAYHDGSIHQPGNETRYPISQLTLDEVQQFTVCRNFCRKYPDVRVPTADEVVDALPEPALYMWDLKGAGIAPAIADFIRARDIVNRSFVSSFNVDVLAEVHARLPEVPIVLYVNSMKGLREKAERTGAKFIRIPKSKEADQTSTYDVFLKGLTPGVSGRFTHYKHVGFGIVTNMRQTVEKNRRYNREIGCVPKRITDLATYLDEIYSE